MERKYEKYLESGEGHPLLADFIPLSCGEEACAPSHAASTIRDYYMIHYVERGCGVFEYRGVRHHLTAGQIFIVCPGEWHRYIADREDPWQYIWFCFRGNRAADFAALPPTAAYPHDTFQRIRTVEEYGEAGALFAAGCLFEILSTLLKEQQPAGGEGYAERARRMLDTLYMLPITVGEVAAQLSLDRHYLPRLFRERYGETMRGYLTRIRMENAARCLGEGYNAEEAGRLSGYTDAVNFYRMFKRYYGVGPAAYRRRLGRAAAQEDGE